MELDTTNDREIDIPKSIKWTWIRMACYFAIVLFYFVALGDYEFDDWTTTGWMAVPVIMVIAAVGCFETYEFAQPKKPVTEYLRKYKAIFMSVAIAFVAIMIPILWYCDIFDTPLTQLFEEHHYSYVQDCFYFGLPLIAFGIIGIEGVALHNNYYGCYDTPLWKFILIMLTAFFGLIGIKYFNLWLMNYSHDNFLISMLLIFTLTILPVGFALSLIACVSMYFID